jgi:hypothetical protein
MQPDPADPIRAEETVAWLEKSRKDLWRAEKRPQARSARHRRLPVPLPYDLVELTRQCVDLEPALVSVLHGVGALTRFA